MLTTVLWMGLAAQAGPSMKAGAGVRTTARLSTQDCLSTPAQCRWLNFRDAAVLSPWASASPSRDVSARIDVDLRIHGRATGYGLEARPVQQPWSLRVQDAWVSARSAHTELKVGIQRIAWGEAQKVSVVDTINPLNLEDPTQLDQRLSTLAATFTAHTEVLALTAVVVPYFVPAALPTVDVDLMADRDDLFDERYTGGKAVDVGALEARPDVPPNTLADTAVAARLRWTPAFGDFAVSWHSGRDSLPQVAGDVRLLGYQTKNDRVDVSVPIAYPRMHTYGFTGRSTLPFDITAWSEFALTMGQRTVAKPSASQLEALSSLGVIDAVPTPVPETETQDGDPITRWIAGLERPFGPVRLVGQWLHGLFTERKQSELKDYAMAGLRWSVSPTVRLDAHTATDFEGHLTDVGITFLHADTAEITVATTQIRGPSESTLGGLESASNVRTQVAMRF